MSVLRNVASKVRANDKAGILEDLKEVYKEETSKVALETLKTFLGKWGKKYPKVKESLEGKDNLFSFMDFPDSIRPSIYTNNISENFNKHLKRKLRIKE